MATKIGNNPTKRVFAEAVLAQFGLAAALDQEEIAKAVEVVKGRAPARFDRPPAGRLKFVVPVGDSALPSGQWKNFFVRQLLEQFGVTGVDDEKVSAAVAAGEKMLIQKMLIQDSKRTRKGLRPRLLFIAAPSKPA